VTNLQNLFFIYKYLLTLFLIKKKWKLFEFCKTLKNCNQLKSLFSAILREKGETEHFHRVEWNFPTFLWNFPTFLWIIPNPGKEYSNSSIEMFSYTEHQVIHCVWWKLFCLARGDILHQRKWKFPTVKKISIGLFNSVGGGGGDLTWRHSELYTYIDMTRP
jgi:hypothetical protein